MLGPKSGLLLGVLLIRMDLRAVANQVIQSLPPSRNKHIVHKTRSTQISTLPNPFQTLALIRRLRIHTYTYIYIYIYIYLSIYRYRESGKHVGSHATMLPTTSLPANMLHSILS